MKTKLSCCIIAKNEERNIERCLKSIVTASHEIILVDTGSTDHTIDIANKYGVKVIETKWKNDFSMARNISLDNASGDWVLFIDCDEELHKNSRKRIKEIIQNSDLEAYQVRVNNILNNKNTVNASSIRLFRNREIFRFRGKIHEQISYSILENFDLKSIGESDICLIHYGYDNNNSNINAKIKRNLEVLNTYSEDEKDGFFYYNLGTEYLRLLDTEKALVNYIMALKQTNPGMGYAGSLVSKTISTLTAMNRFKDALEQARYFQTIYKDYKDLYYLEATCNIKCGYYSEAVKNLKTYISMPKSPIHYPSEEFMTSDSTLKLIKDLQLKCICNENNLSVCIVSRNDSKVIAECIRSINEFAKEVILIDLESQDRTIEIASQMGARVYSYKGDSDFSKVRNFAIEKANGDWILFLEGNMVFQLDSNKKLTDVLNYNEYEGYKLKIHTFFDAFEPMENCFTTTRCLLFKKAIYKFSNQELKDIEEAILRIKGRIGFVDISINQLSYLDTKEHITEKRELIFEAYHDKDYILGMKYFFEKDYFNAEIHFETYSKNKFKKAEFYYFYSVTLMNLNNFSEAYRIMNEGLKDFPDYTDLFYIKGILSFMSGDTESSIQLFHKCLSLGDAPIEKYGIFQGCGSFKAEKSLGLAYSAVGNFDSALEVLLKLAQTSYGFNSAIEEITIIFIKTSKLSSLEKYMKANNLFNSNSIHIVSRTCAKLNCFSESLKFLQKDKGKDTDNTIKSFDLLLNTLLYKLGT